MKWTHFIASACALLLLGGCASINRTEKNTLIQHNVSPVVSERMVRGDILSLSDIIELSQKDVPTPLIIRYLYTTRAVYVLDKQALARLNRGKVRKEIIDYLLDTPTLFGPQNNTGVYYGAPAWYPPYGGYYPYYPYGPGFYGSSSVIIVGGRGRCR